MPLNASLVGKTYPAVPFPVVAEHVGAFSAAVAHPGDGVPPTFATAPELLAGLRNVLADPELGLDLARVLHGEQAYEWARPIETGEVLTAEASIEQIRAKGGVELLTLRTDLRDETDRIVVVARSTLIVRSSGQ